jgi:hypothetical protein
MNINNNNNQILYNTILTNVQKNHKKKKKLESQFILPYIKKYIDFSPKSPQYIKDGLIYLYSNHFGNDQIIKRSKEPINNIKIRIKKQLEVLEKNSIIAGEKIDENLNTDQEIDLLFLIWCDMIHDQNISITNDNKSFSKFINSDIAKKLFGNRERKFIYTNYIKNLIKILRKNPKSDRVNQEFFFTNTPGNNTKDITKGSTTKTGWTTGWWEKIWKREIIQTVSYNSNQNGANYEKNTVILRPSEVRPKLFKRQILVSIDQEPNTSKNVSSALFRSKNDETFVKLLQPTISIANLIDPGSDMVKNSINANKTFLDASNTNTNQIRSKVRWNLIPYEFKLGNMNIKTELVQKPINKGGSKYTYDYVINNEKYKSNVAKKSTSEKKENGENVAKKSTSNKEEANRKAKELAEQKKKKETVDSISKFAGDFYQILTALRMQKAGQLYVPASGDGMFCVIYAYLAKYVYKITPRIIFIKDRGGTEPTNLVFLNLKEYMNNPNTRVNSTRVFTEKRKFNSISSSISGSNSNSNNEVSSTNRSIIKKARNAVNQNAKNAANQKAKAKAIENQKARNAAIQKANANAIQKARNEAIRKARNAANQKARNAAIQNANANANQKARNAVNQNAKANEKQNARNAANQKAKRNEFINKIKKFTNLDNRTKRGFILGFNNGENANNLLKQAERDNKNKKEGLAAIRKQTLRKR